jgi:hypothetical protein
LENVNQIQKKEHGYGHISSTRFKKKEKIEKKIEDKKLKKWKNNCHLSEF